MTHNNRRIGIIDIGSNSIRLVVYELTAGSAYRVVDESKRSARLSGKVTPDGRLESEQIRGIVEILQHFQKLCAAHRTDSIRTVATAAIRNATNSEQIVAELESATGLRIEVLSGDEEAQLGFYGMINTMEMTDGFLIDIGGGSTEISLFRDRKLLRSVSLPYGCVNASRLIAQDGPVTDADIARIRHMITRALEPYPWVRLHPGLPLVGLGGTVRNLCKIHQRQIRYSLPVTHNYRMSGDEMLRLQDRLASLPLDKRKKVDGLSSDRADILVPGTVILTTVYMLAESSEYRISGAGLRDGLFYELLYPERPVLDRVLDHSVRNMLQLQPYVSLPHVEQVDRIALQLFDELQPSLALPPRCRDYLHTAALLYRIGISVQYYDYRKHSFYLIAHSRLDGLSHREIVLCALIASYKTKNRLRRLSVPYRDLLSDADLDTALQLAILLNAAIALDRSETQPLARLSARMTADGIELHGEFRHNPDIELRQFEEIRKEWRKAWGLNLKLIPSSTSR